MEVPKHFIVLDDDRSNNLICEFSVRRFSAAADIKTFLDPEVALQYIRDNYDEKDHDLSTVLFLDINMPILSGWEFLEIFEEFPSKIKNHFRIYMLTSSIDTRDQEKASANILVQGFLSKPLSAKMVADIFSR